jgi:hypothetical protein
MNTDKTMNPDKVLKDFSKLTGITYKEIEDRFFDMCDLFCSEYLDLKEYCIEVVDYNEKKLKLKMNGTIKIDNGKYNQDICDFYTITTERDYLGYLDYYVE